MKNKKVFIIISIVLILIILGGVGFFVWKNSQGDDVIIEPSGDVEPELSLAEKAIVKTVEINDNSPSAHRSISVKYPSIQSFGNKDFQNYINTQIMNVILAYRDEIVTVIDDETPDTALYTYKTSYEKYACGDFLSLVISNDYNTYGIRSSKWKDTYNIDVRRETLIDLEDLFDANVDYEDAIIYVISEQAKMKNIILFNGLDFEGLSASQKFYIRDEKLIIHFDPSEIAATSYGELEFEMPFRLKENGKFEIPSDLIQAMNKENLAMPEFSGDVSGETA